MTVLNKYITNVLFLGLFLFASCEDKIEKIFLSNAIECYRSKYGIYIQVDNYVIGFQPTLYVLELFE